MKYVNEAYDFVNHAWSKGKIQKLIAPLEGLAYCTTVKGFKEVGLGVQPEESNYFNFFQYVSKTWTTTRVLKSLIATVNSPFLLG